MFSVELIDKDGGEIKAAFFGEAVDRFFDMLHERRMFSFSGGTIKRANKQYYSRGEHEITFDERARIEPCDDDGRCPVAVYDFKPLLSVKDLPSGSFVDVAAIVVSTSGVVEQTLKAGGSKPKQDVTLLDDSGASIRITLWGESAQDAAWVEGAVVLLKGVKTSDFGGCSLNTNFGTQILLGEEAKRAHDRASQLLTWYAANGDAAKREAQTLSGGQGSNVPPQCLAEVKEEAHSLEVQFGAPGAAQGQNSSKYHTVSPATVTYLPHERAPFYLACPHLLPDDRKPGEMRPCNRKSEQSGGGYICAMGHECQEPTARWMGQFSIADQSGTQYISAFDAETEQILGAKANEIAALWERKDCDAAAATRIEEIFRRPQYTRWRMRLRSKKEVWNDEERIKVNLVDAKPLDLEREGRRMLGRIHEALPRSESPGVGLPGGA